jgi:hypothetical protein
VRVPARLVAAVAVGLVLSACSTVPSSSPTVPITQVPTRQDTEVGIEPLAPEEGASPEEIVRGFIDAAASTGRGHPVARQHLTPRASDEWADDAGVIVIEPGFATVTSSEGVVEVTAQTVGTVDERGIFSVTDDAFTREYTVEKVEGEWRIQNPPAGLVILEPDFERVYDQLNAYFLDATGQRMVPDPRYLVGGEAQPTALVERLFDGPSPELRSGVQNPVEGFSLRRPVTVEGATATVDLTGLPADPEPPLEPISAQLVWTLEQAGIRSVEVLIEGEAVRLPQVPRAQTVENWASYDPDAVPLDAVGHYVDEDGALRTADAGKPVPGPAGQGSYRLQSAGVAVDKTSGALSFLVGVAPGEGGSVRLLDGPYGGRLAAVLTNGDSFPEPTVAGTRTEVWTVRDGSQVVRVRPGTQPQDVSAPTLADLGEVTALQLSPDGVRAAVIIDGDSGPELYLGVVARGDENSVALRDLDEVNPGLEDPVDVTWLAGDTLMVLASNADDEVVPWQVGVDGWGLTEIPRSGLPDQPTTVGAAPDRQPLVGTADGTMWRLVGANWQTLVAGAEPLRGREPFYPL